MRIKRSVLVSIELKTDGLRIVRTYQMGLIRMAQLYKCDRCGYTSQDKGEFDTVSFRRGIFDNENVDLCRWCCKKFRKPFKKFMKEAKKKKKG